MSLLGVGVFSALDHRFDWSHMPSAVCILGVLLVVLANVIWFYVQKENSYWNYNTFAKIR
jgi:protein-S-isoprenylcysteine O-methyltransferase Ste14